MTNFYNYAKNTGIGAPNISWCGKKINFTKKGKYPKNTNEYLWIKYYKHN
jgi:hypothetical protein